jgi:hypothetical protein
MHRYLAECYLPDAGAPDVVRVAARLRSAAAALTRGGEQLHYVGSTFIAREGTCFCQFAAASPEVVAQAFGRAGVPVARISEVTDFPEHQEDSCAP